MTIALDAGTSAPLQCSGCGTTIAPSLRSCPGCHALVHAGRLRALASRAEAASAEADVLGALTALRESLDLLPPQSRQFAVVAERVSSLGRTLDETRAGAAPVPNSGAWKWLAAAGPIALVVWKLKFVVVLLATKGKLLLLGLTKASTFFSMLLSLGVYWTTWGLPFAFGFVISIYIHEMGHVAALRRYGIPATAPMFIPGLGALIRLRQSPMNPRENARVGLAGPIWGLGAAVASYGAATAGGGAMFLAIASTGAWLNLFNLLPVWQLDGNRAFAALTSAHRWAAVLTLGAAWLIARDGLLVLLLIVAIARAFGKDAPAEPDHGALWRYAGVTIALAVLVRIAHVP